MPCPRLNIEKQMHMIGHHNVRFQFDVRKMSRDLKPAFIHYSANRVQFHLIADDLSKDASLSVRTNRDEIGAGLGIIKTLQANGASLRQRECVVHEVAGIIARQMRHDTNSIAIPGTTPIQRQMKAGTACCAPTGVNRLRQKL